MLGFGTGRTCTALSAPNTDRCDGDRPSTRTEVVPCMEHWTGRPVALQIRAIGLRDYCDRSLWLDGVERSHGVPGAFRGLTFELSGRQRQGARPGLAKMYNVPPARAWWHAAGAPLERGVRPLFHGGSVSLPSTVTSPVALARATSSTPSSINSRLSRSMFGRWLTKINGDAPRWLAIRD